jgi:mono/diheme cytochrome c family protein
MRHSLGLGLAIAIVVAALLVPAVEVRGSAVAEPSAPAGSAVYQTYCAVCHGSGGKGDGRLADALRYRPSDLTRLAKRNGGPYPAEQVHRIIDGRKPVAGHGGPDMPVWGDAFKNATEGYSEEAVRQKIEALVEYLRSLQVETGK